MTVRAGHRECRVQAARYTHDLSDYNVYNVQSLREHIILIDSYRTAVSSE